MFNDNVMKVLTQISTLTNSVILKYPQTVATSEAGDMLLLVDMSKLDSGSFPNIGLKNNLNELLNLIKLFPEDRQIVVNENTIQVESGELSSTFITDVVELMDAYNIDPIQFERTEAVPSVATFDLTANEMKNLKSASGVFKNLTEVLFESIDGDIRMSLAATNKFNAKSNTFSITKSANTSKEFSVIIPVENFKLLPTSDYTFHIKYNSSKDAYRIMLTNKSFDGLKVIMSVKA